MKKFYLTTPLYYVNAKPHLGHAYTTIVADTLARWHRQQGEEVFLLTGTDEHGEKIALAAQAQGVSPKAFADKTSETFRSLWKALGISYDFFIRTTDPEHERIVQRVLEKLRPQLELGRYRFWYCVPCETSFGLSEVDPAKPVCPNCQRPINQVEEEDYFFPLEKHRQWLKDHLRQNGAFIFPLVRRNELLAMLEKELPPLCITRPKERVSWGIEVPFSPGHVTYVWFDALLNYITALDWPEGEKFQRYWKEAGALHLIGKDILRHHALYWPIILHALGVDPPRMIFAHGWWLITPPPALSAEGGSAPRRPVPPPKGGGTKAGGGVKGEKMSKSKGNIVEPEAVVAAYGLDAFRYFLLRDVPFGEDGVFSEEALIKRINADLANDLGNLVYRTLTMLEKHTAGRIPASKLTGTGQGKQWVSECQAGIENGISQLAPEQALKALWELISKANHSVEEKAPWTLAREEKRQELEEFLYQLAEILRVIALFLWPFMPVTAESIWQQLGLDSPLGEQILPSALEKPVPAGLTIRKGKPLFPRLE